MKISASNSGRVLSAETRAKMGEAMVQRYVEGLVPTHFTNTRPHLDLANFLLSAGYDLATEVQFGRYRVDLYDPTRHLAFEADGGYWHRRKERERPGYYARRDARLLAEYGLPVVRFTEDEIERLVA